MTLILLFLALFGILVYWLMIQILPERRKHSLLRPGLGDGLLTHLNERRRADGLPILEMDDELMLVAEQKSVHQIMTGDSESGWEYPPEYDDMFGRSLLMEVLVTGSMNSMVDRLAHHRDIFDGEWIRCGIGVAGGQSNQVVVALILCREAWEPVPEVAQQKTFADRFAL